MDVLIYTCTHLMIATMFFYLGAKVNDMRIRGRLRRVSKPRVNDTFFTGDAIHHIFQLNVLDKDIVMEILESIYD